MANWLYNLLCKSFGHKFDDVEMALFKMEHNAFNREVFADRTIRCRRCGVEFKHKFETRGDKNES